MPTNANDAVGKPSAKKIIAEQEEKYGGASSAELVTLARDAFADAAEILHEGRANNPRQSINDAYRRAGEGRAMLEVVARRLMEPTQRNREES